MMLSCLFVLLIMSLSCLVLSFSCLCRYVVLSIRLVDHATIVSCLVLFLFCPFLVWSIRHVHHVTIVSYLVIFFSCLFVLLIMSLSCLVLSFSCLCYYVVLSIHLVDHAMIVSWLVTFLSCHLCSLKKNVVDTMNRQDNIMTRLENDNTRNTTR